MAEKTKIIMGNRIKNLRELSGLTQKELAEKVGISNASLSNYEKDINEPTLAITARLADVFGVSTDYLINGNTEPVERIIESKTGLSTESVRFLKRIKNYCDNESIKNPLNELIEKADFQDGINELLCMIMILINDSKGTTNKDVGKLVHRLNVAHILNGGETDGYQGIFYEIARLHTEDAKNSIEKAIDKIRTEVWDNGKR